MKAKKSPISAPVAPAIVVRPVFRELVAERAYSIWLARGRPDGRDYDHWVEAERQLLNPMAEEPAETLASKMTHWDEPLTTDIERELDSIAPTSGQRSATSL
jgi:hypothetical protein